MNRLPYSPQGATVGPSMSVADVTVATINKNAANSMASITVESDIAQFVINPDTLSREIIVEKCNNEIF